MRTDTVSIGQTTFLLAQGQQVGDLEDAVVDALQVGGALVRFTDIGNRLVRIAVSPGVPVVFETIDRADDPHDDGDLHAPYATDNHHFDIDTIS